jgi:hypothetical protein
VQHAGALAGLLQAEDLRALLAALHATAALSQEGGELLITLPGDIDA